LSPKGGHDMLGVYLGLVLALGSSAAQGELRFEKIEAAHGLLGPLRKSLDCYPEDEVLFRFMVAGLATTAESKVDCLRTVTLKDAKGDTLLQGKRPMVGVLGLGGGVIPADANLTLGEKLAPGQYTVVVHFRDNLAAKAVTFERKLNVKPAEFALVAQRFFF